MKTSAIFFGLSALLSVTFVLANPTPTDTKRCEACDEACPKNWFYYHPKQCCLQNGGPPTVAKPPTTKACPMNWYWHLDLACCAPMTKPPTTFPVPSCQGAFFPWWNPSNQCCENPKPQTSPVVVKGVQYKKSVHTKNSKDVLKPRKEDACPSDLEFCPIPGSEDEFECVDPLDMRACGGCPSLGKGRDCTAIVGASGVGCAPEDPITMVPVCQVTSCQENYTLSSDGKSCTPALVSQ